MRTHTRLSLTVALLALALPAHLSAQRGRGGGGGFSGGRVAMPREGFRPSIPREPTPRDAAHPAPLIEPGRPRSAVPYVRDDHWYGHAAVDDARFRLANPFAHRRFTLTGPGHVFGVTRFDLGARRIWLPGGLFEVADWDWAVTAPWCWTCDQFVVYPDPDHPGWYLVYDTRMGEYVHAQFLGA